MNATRCEGCKQFYDLEKFNECPYCHAPAHNIQNKGFDMQNFNNPVEQAAAEEKIVEKQHRSIFGKKKQHDVMENKPTNEERAVEQPIAQQTAAQESAVPAFNNVPNTEETRNAPPVFNPPIQHKQANIENQMGSLAQAVSQSQPDDMKTVAFYNFSNNADPVVGWLICVKGEYIGESFNIVSGRNNIGRALTNNIALTKEKTVSREKHAAIIFEPRNKQFFIQPGESSGLTYLNDELILGVKPLKHKDFINMGATKFMFFQLCDEKFSWDKYLG